MSDLEKKVRTYDMRTMYRAFEVLKAGGRLNDYLDKCDQDGHNIHLHLGTAIDLKDELKSVWPDVQANHQHVLASIFPIPPAAPIGDDCPICPS